MSFSRTCLVLVALCTLLLPLVSHAQPGQQGERKVDLRPKFRQGQTMRLKMEVANSSQPDAPAPKPGGQRPQPLKSKIEMGLSLKVVSVDDSRNATVEMVFDSMKVSSNVGEEKIEFDSTKPPKDDGDITGMLFQGLTGTALTMKVDSSGNITSISGGEAFTALGQSLGGGGTGGAGQLFGPLFSIKSGSGIVTVGESWENIDQIDNALFGKFKMTSKHTLRSVLGTDAQVDVVGRIEPSSEGGDAGGVAQIKNSRYGGRYSWDTETGMLRQMDTTLSVTLEQNVGGVKSTSRNESVMKVTRLR